MHCVVLGRLLISSAVLSTSNVTNTSNVDHERGSTVLEKGQMDPQLSLRQSSSHQVVSTNFFILGRSSPDICPYKVYLPQSAQVGSVIFILGGDMILDG